MNSPLPRLTDVYVEIFERVLGERVSQAGVRLAHAEKLLERAKRSGRPILFVLNDSGYADVPRYSLDTRKLLQEHLLIELPLLAAPALSQLTGQPPFESSHSGQVIVVANSDGKQLASVTHWNDVASLHAALAIGWIDAMVKNPPSVRDQVRAERLLQRLSPAGKDWGSELNQRLKNRDQPLRNESSKKDLYFAASP